jgi:hypothetical protein
MHPVRVSIGEEQFIARLNFLCRHDIHSPVFEVDTEPAVDLATLDWVVDVGAEATGVGSRIQDQRATK